MLLAMICWQSQYIPVAANTKTRPQQKKIKTIAAAAAFQTTRKRLFLPSVQNHYIYYPKGYGKGDVIVA